MKTSEELLNGKSKSMRTILLIEADKKHARKFKEIIEPLDLACTHVTNFDDRKQIFSHTPFICLVDVINNKKNQVKDFIHRYRVTNPYAVCIVTAEAEQQTQVLEYLDLGVYDYLLKPFDPLTVNKVLEHCLERITVQIDNNRLQNQLYEVRNEAGLFSDMLSMVFNAAKRFISCDYLDELGGVIMNEFSNIFNIMGGSLFVLENEKLQRLYSLDPGHTPEEIRLPLEGSSIFGQVMQRKEPLLFKDFNEEQQYSSSGWKGYKNESFLVLPLIHNTHHFVGCVSLHNKENNGFTADDKKIGGVLSGLSASVIHAVKNIEKLRESEEKYRYFFDRVIRNRVYQA
ncbi:MAG: GAF domain-containing protein [Spirochaetia bacterium]